MSRRLLIVDDNTEFRKIIRSFVEGQHLGLQIFEASTAEMGITKSSCTAPDVILMDINLPGANGLSAISHIKADHPACKVIVVTMFDIKEFKELARKLDVMAFVGKTEIYDQLVPLIKEALGTEAHKSPEK